MIEWRLFKQKFYMENGNVERAGRQNWGVTIFWACVFKATPR